MPETFTCFEFLFIYCDILFSVIIHYNFQNFRPICEDILTVQWTTDCKEENPREKENLESSLQ